MQIRSPRTILAMSAVLALGVSALAPTAAFAKGPGPGAADCDGDCTHDTPQLQEQVRAQDGTGGGAQNRGRARDGSGQQTEIKANAGGGGQVQARAGKGRAQEEARGNRGMGAKAGAGRGWDEETPRGPEGCDECEAEMGELTAIDTLGLQYMVEEEKLAHDVYVAFAQLYDLRTFERIAESEARHMAAVQTVLERYGIADPTIGSEPGVFVDPDLQKLYDELIAQGSLGLDEALAAAITIEQVDIEDLEARIAALGRAPDVFTMYTHLLTASRQHLAAFERQS